MSEPPEDAVCDECDEPLGIDYQERVIAMIGEYEIVELTCDRCKWKESLE